ncbi:MAG: hypothetical protein DWQ06_00510 [Calditrichaeota bacterium]|nr:MAG: hypothetical protein DWQ06_00510 [Calditrichota bacterium]
MRTASTSKNSVIFILPIIFLLLTFFILQEGIEKGAEIFLGFGILTIALLNYNVAVVIFFILGMFFRNILNINLLNISVLDPFNVISLVLFYHFISKGILFRKSLFKRSYTIILLFCFLGNLIFCFRYWIHLDFVFGSQVNSYLLSFIIVPIQTIFILSQIFKNVKEEKEIEFFNKIIIYLSIFCFFYLLEIYFSFKVLPIGSESDTIWVNKLLGHKNSYGTFFVIMFFMFLHFFNFEKENKKIHITALISCLGIVAISLSRNAYLALICVSIFLVFKGIMANQKAFFALFIGGIALTIISGEAITERATSVINPIIGGNVEGLRDASSGHFSELAFDEIAYWLSENPLFGGFFDSQHYLESGWTELIQKQGLIGLMLYILFLWNLHRYLYPRIFSINIKIKKYAVIGYTTLLCIYIMNITDFLIYTYSNTPLYFLLTYVYLALRWYENQEMIIYKDSSVNGVGIQNDDS